MLFSKHDDVFQNTVHRFCPNRYLSVSERIPPNTSCVFSDLQDISNKGLSNRRNVEDISYICRIHSLTIHLFLVYINFIL